MLNIRQYNSYSTIDIIDYVSDLVPAKHARDKRAFFLACMWSPIGRMFNKYKVIYYILWFIIKLKLFILP